MSHSGGYPYPQDCDCLVSFSSKLFEILQKENIDECVSTSTPWWVVRGLRSLVLTILRQILSLSEAVVWSLSTSSRLKKRTSFDFLNYPITFWGAFPVLKRGERKAVRNIREINTPTTFSIQVRSSKEKVWIWQLRTDLPHHVSGIPNKDSLNVINLRWNYKSDPTCI